MRLNLIAVMTLAFVFFMSPPVDAKNIFKVGRDITLEEGQSADNVVAVGGQITVSGLVEK